MTNIKSSRIIFRLDEDSLDKLAKKSIEESIQQSKLLKIWLKESLNCSFYKTADKLKLNKSITLFIDKNLLDEIDKKAKLIGITRSSYIYNVLCRKVNYKNNAYREVDIKNQRFDYYYLNGEYKYLLELVGDKIELLSNDRLIDYGFMLVLLGKNSKAKEIIGELKARLKIPKDQLISEIALEQGRLLILQSRLARAIASATKAKEYAEKALEIGTIIDNNELKVQAYFRIASGYLGIDDFVNSMKSIEKAKEYINFSKFPRTLVSAYLLECYIYLYTLQFTNLKICIESAKDILKTFPQAYYMSELLYIELRLLYLISNNQEEWNNILPVLMKFVSITGSEFHRISIYNETAAFFLKINRKDVAQNYITKARDLENIYFNYEYNKSSFSNTMHLAFLSNYNLEYFTQSLTEFIDTRKKMKDNYIFYEYLRASANLFYSEDEDLKHKSINKLKEMKEDKDNPLIGYAANISLEERKYLFIR